MPERIFNVIFQPEPEGGFTAIVPSLPGCITYGKTLEKAQEMVKEAMELYLECLQEDGEEIPPNDAHAFFTPVNVPKRPSTRSSSRHRVRRRVPA